MTSTAPKLPRVPLPVQRVTPYLLLAGILVFGCTLQWYAGAILGRHGLAVHPLTFFPQGWHLATYAIGPGALLPLLPLHWLGGPAFAYNVGALLTFVIAFIGMRRLARSLLNDFGATLAALLYTFLALRWYATAGHMNTLLASALLPWMVWTLERGLAPAPPPGLTGDAPAEGSRASPDAVDAASGSRSKGLGWFALAGLLWALAITSSGYFVWIGGVLMATWLAGCLLARKATLRRTLVAAAVVAAVALGLSAPWLIWFWRERSVIGATLFDIRQMSTWDASLNSLPIPNVSHPWLRGFARWVYRGPLDESGRANLGLIASLLAVVGATQALKERRWRPALLITVVGLALALGLTLKWNGEQIPVAALRPLNTLIWRVGHTLKPGFFVSELPSPP
jgi:hypothetical protein